MSRDHDSCINPKRNMFDLHRMQIATSDMEIDNETHQWHVVIRTFAEERYEGSALQQLGKTREEHQRWRLRVVQNIVRALVAKHGGDEEQ